MFRKYIKNLFAYDYIIKLKQLWISHFAALGVYICEGVVIINTCALSTENMPSDLIFNFKDAFLISHYVIFILYGECLLILISLNFIIWLFFKTYLITKNHFLLNNTIYHKFWLFGILIAAITLIMSAIWFLYVFLRELI